MTCPKCGSDRVVLDDSPDDLDREAAEYRCLACGESFGESAGFGAQARPVIWAWGVDLEAGAGVSHAKR